MSRSRLTVVESIYHQQAGEEAEEGTLDRHGIAYREVYARTLGEGFEQCEAP